MSELQRGLDAYATGAWRKAFESLSEADRVSALEPENLELLATSAYMLGQNDEFVNVLERAHRSYLRAGEVPGAVHCAVWLGLGLAMAGEMSRAAGWFSRAERLLEGEEGGCVERGYLLIPVLLAHVAAGDHQAAYEAAVDAADLGERFGDADLLALVVQEQGHALVRLGQVEEGLRLVDEVMVGVIAGELSPIVTGLVYCNTIAFCQSVYELRRASEWTNALTKWCEHQPDMVAHTGVCLVHRAEIKQLQGEWPDALEEARRAGERFAQGKNREAAGQAIYRQGEVFRLQGDLGAAEDAFRQASRDGFEPQPGLALVRLAQGNREAAVSSIRRVTGEATDQLRRAGLLPAYVEIMLASGNAPEAQAACRELEEISARQGSLALAAMSTRARGAVALAEGEADAALVALRRAWQAWQELEAPFESARVRVLVGLACRALGDEDTAELELAAARGVFAELGATPELTRVDSLLSGRHPGDAYGLTPRELQVLRLVAAGATNKAIAAELVLSERTVDRHTSNIFAKLGVSSRTGAAAYAYEHQLL